jgi:predicted TIM-barrel fold metal-dependent hydrolase
VRVVALEEHFTTPELGAPRAGVAGRGEEVAARLLDVGEGRLAAMDAAGIDLQVLSSTAPGTQHLPPAASVDASRRLNDQLAEVVAAHPDRFAGFASLPTPAPEEAGKELVRCVEELGFVGAMVHGHTQGRFLDEPGFAPILAAAEDLGVPLYLHPTLPPPAVRDAYYAGLPEAVAATLAGPGWGWHAETALHVLRMVVGGVFDRHPRLQLIVGHMGENLPFSLARADATLSPVATHLARRVADYVHEHLWVTTSAYFTLPPFECARSVIGIDRMLFSVDYPFADPLAGRRFLDGLPVPPADREKLAHGNAERLLRLPVPTDPPPSRQGPA